MGAVQITILTICVLVIAFIIWRYFATLTAGDRIINHLVAEIEPITTAVREGKSVSSEEIEKFAARVDTRSMLYRAFHELNKPELFPDKYKQLQYIAASDLVVWLLHPNELGVVPDEIEMVKEIVREDGAPSKKYSSFVFKFCTSPPNWAAADGWLTGVAGPYWQGEDPVQSPAGVFSCFDVLDVYTPEGHLARIEGFLAKKN